MAFKSKKQMAKFAQLESEGKLPKGTFNRWKEETKKISELPTYSPTSNRYKPNPIKKVKKI